MEENEKVENKKNLEVITGDGSNLNISGVYDHINTGRPTYSDKKPKHIVVPQENKKEKK